MDPIIIDGIVGLKRKSSWVNRYAYIQGTFFGYKKNKSDKNPRRLINLIGCKFRRGTRLNKQRFISIEAGGNQFISISMSDMNELEQWLKKLMEVADFDVEKKREEIALRAMTE
jgi:hypothetical protein